MTWRQTRKKGVELTVGPAQLVEMLQSVQSTLAEFPNECLFEDQLWSDSSEKANGVTRDRLTDSLCVTVTLWDQGVRVCHYSLPEESSILLGARFYQVITSALAPHL